MMKPGDRTEDGSLVVIQDNGGSKFNLAKADGRPVSEMWFDGIRETHGSSCVVISKDFNALNPDGDEFLNIVGPDGALALGDYWVMESEDKDAVDWDPSVGLYRVVANGHYYAVAPDGRSLSGAGFDYMEWFEKTVNGRRAALVEKETVMGYSEINWMFPDGSFVMEDWVIDISEGDDLGYAVVDMNDGDGMCVVNKDLDIVGGGDTCRFYEITALGGGVFKVTALERGAEEDMLESLFDATVGEYPRAWYDKVGSYARGVAHAMRTDGRTVLVDRTSRTVRGTEGYNHVSMPDRDGVCVVKGAEGGLSDITPNK